MRLALYLDEGLICGGAERVALRLLNYWCDLGWEVFLITRNSLQTDFYSMPPEVNRLSMTGCTSRQESPSAKPGWLADARATVIRFLPARSFLKLVYESILLRNVLKHLDVDLVVSFLTPANVKLLLSTYNLRCRVVVSERNDTRTYRYPFIWLAMRRLLYRYADMVTANIVATILDMERYVPKARLAFVPNPVEFPPPDATARADCSNRIVSVGRLVSYKRHLMLIQAFASLSKNFAAWELDIVGEGPMRPELEKAIADQGLSCRIHLHGLSNDVNAYYRAGGIFVLPSRVEGTPNALLEAMAHSLPCIVSNSLSGATAHIENGITGLTFSSEDTADLAAKIETLAQSTTLRRQLGINARKKLMGSSYTMAYEAWDRVISSAFSSEDNRAAFR